MEETLYRAKDLDGNYIIGYYSVDNGKSYIDSIEINRNTLAIHFSDMVTPNDIKVFASLSDAGVGGDICVFGGATYIMRYLSYKLVFVDADLDIDEPLIYFSPTIIKELELKGIQDA